MRPQSRAGILLIFFLAKKNQRTPRPTKMLANEN
jgi:hypothetical protein